MILHFPNLSFNYLDFVDNINMSQSPTIGNSSILDTLRNYKPVEKPKFTHVPNYSSSSEGSPVLRNRNPIMISDSESEGEVIICEDSDDNDCMIVTNSQNESNENSVKDNSNSVGDSNSVNCNSGDEPLRVIKRKKKVFNNKRKKRIRKGEGSDTDMGLGDASFQPDQVCDSDEDELSMNVKQPLRKKVVDLLNSGNEKELNTIPNMNPKKLQILISNRPYSSWEHMVRKFNDTKGINISLLNVICDTLIAKDTVLEIMAKCEELASKTEQKISSGVTLVSEQPALLNSEYQLSGYQLLGLNWLALMRSRCLNSILADEMGLGKTIQVIAFLAYLKGKELVLKGYPHLIVVPSSTLNNWYDEFQRWCPSLKIVIYHGNQLERRILRHTWFNEGFGDTDVVLTTYRCAASSREEKKMFRVKEFNYVIFDEAHMLKNMNTQRYEALIQFNGNFKILLTGTPLQNNLLELMSLLIFLMPNLFKSKVHHIKLLFAKSSKITDENSSDFEKEKMRQAKRIIEPFMLRRLKENVLRDLPSKTINVEKCPLLSEQLIKYDEILEQFKIDAASKDSNCYMSYFMMLRKMANHPLLLRYYFTEDKLEKMSERLATDHSYKGTNAEYIKEDLYFKSDYELHNLCQEIESLHNLEFTLPDETFCNSGKLKKLTPLLFSFKEKGHRVLIFSQFILMLDVLQEYCRINNFTYLRLDGSTPTAERQEMIDLFNMDQEIFLFLLSTKAGGLGINLTAADTVIIHDVDFNPYNDKQAEDRCHRVGQKKSVQVIKLIGESTVEEKMYSAGVSKLCLEKQITACNEEEDTDSKTVVQLLKETLGL